MQLDVKSSAFEEGARIPERYTVDGADISPPLAWSGVPEGTQSIALICDDPDAPVGTWVHWVLYGLSAETTELPESIPPQEQVLGSAKHGTTDFGDIGYGGPAPPPGKVHRYFFKVYALDSDIDLASRATKAELLSAMEGHILAEGSLMGTYSR